MLGTQGHKGLGVSFPHGRQIGSRLLLSARHVGARLGQLTLQVRRLLGEPGYVGALGG